jgi:hypothetical protein
MYQADAFDRILGLQGATQKLFADCTGVGDRPSPLALQKVLLALELRWRLEESVLIPTLQDTQGVMPVGSDEAARELAALRGLVGLTLEISESQPQARRTLICVLEVLNSLRSERLNGALRRAARACLVDQAALGAEMDRRLEAWRAELGRPGDGDGQHEVQESPSITSDRATSIA